MDSQRHGGAAIVSWPAAKAIGSGPSSFQVGVMKLGSFLASQSGGEGAEASGGTRMAAPPVRSCRHSATRLHVNSVVEHRHLGAGNRAHEAQFIEIADVADAENLPCNFRQSCSKRQVPRRGQRALSMGNRPDIPKVFFTKVIPLPFGFMLRGAASPV
jgi:hypothetical protein